MPFHQISQWTGGFFEDTSLTKIGLEIHLSHQGKPCPEVTDDWYDTIDEGDNFAECQWVPLVNDPRTTMVVDTSGVHSLMIRFCRCASALGPNMQLFEISLFPASFTSLKTAFTFAVLDDFLLDNLECGTSAMNYYSKLRRITSSVFPHLVPRIDEGGQAVETAEAAQVAWKGMCPDPAWLYSRSLVMDGNFKAEHMFPANPTNEVALTDGLGFMVGDGRYKLHLAEAQDIVHWLDCNNHQAVNQANTSRHNLEATGIGGCACARHGCFVPHSMVDFQKGERQMNMDYALCQALGYNTDGIDQALTFYDINCQYHKHLHQRVEESPYLDLPWGMEVIPGIDLWHVHGHQDKCYVRYASNFITSAARIDGEIMETLWVPLNIISPSVRGMSTPHQKECLDFQMNDCNFMKMIWMSKFLCRKFKEAVQGVRDSQHAFDRLSETADDDTLVKWEAEAAAAQDDRLENPSAMDIYEVKMTKALTRKQQELHLLTRHVRWPAGEIHRGAATWLASGITLEEAQVALLIDVKKLGRRPTDAQKLAIARRHDRTASDQLDEYDKLDLMTMMLDAAELDSAGSSSDDPDRPDDEDRYDTLVKFTPKTLVIPLPSNIGIERCAEWGVADLVLQEISLREGQANDALHAIRVNLANKAVLFRTTVWSAKSQARSTCAWARVHSVDKILHLNVQMYSKCRSQLVHLSADDLLVKLRPLEKADLKATTVVADPNARRSKE
ncbi:hypothetical protein F4604DRAFT_1917014 [Suillus subluteus]|nr:hypothetical protein F4604DRAFT_1917014 [Suillus subluteus]